MLQYKCAVVWLNAGSQASLENDYHRLYDTLQLRCPGDKIEAVKGWFSQSHNQKWLLVFDNANSPDKVGLEKYIPIVNWGHIIFTTRDQAVMGTLCQRWIELQPLPKEASVSLLVETSGPANSNQPDMQAAEEVAEILGYLPLAMVHAAAFMRSRHKTFRKYKDMFATGRDQLLGFAPRFGSQQSPVLRTWELSFKELEQDSQDAVAILLLFSFLDPGSIPEILLYRGCTANRRWDDNGEIVDVAAHEEGVEEGLASLIGNEFRLDDAIERLFALSLISCQTGPDNGRTFSIHPLVQHCVIHRLSPGEVKRWRLQALLLVCHAFPRNRYLEPR